MRRAYPLAACVALSACAGPRPEAPAASAIVPPSTWRDGAGSAETAIDPKWWRAFGDSALNDVVETALANNTDIAIAASRVEEARAQFRLARSQQLPGLNVVGAGDRDRSVTPFGMGVDQWAGKGEAQASFDLDLFGRLAKATDAARAQLLATQDARDNVRLAIAASAASGYVTLRALDARLAVLRNTLTSREGALRLTKRRSDSGYSSRLDLSQAQAEYEATAQLIPAVELAIARQENGLSVLLGQPPGEIRRGIGLDAIALPAAPVGLPSSILARRPDIAAAANQIIAADRSLDSARTAFMPNVRLTASGGAVASSLLANPISVFALGGSILAPIFQGGRLRAQADAAASRRDQAAFAYRKTVLTAFREVEDGLAAQRLLSDQERALEAQRAALAQSLRLADRRYREGYSPYLELLDAQRAFLSSQLSLVQSRADRLVATIALLQALGGGWVPQDAGPTVPN